MRYSKNKGTLQDWFYTKEKSVFPSRKDYVSHYNAFKEFLDNEVHPHINTVMSREEPTMFLNDHSEKHVAMVMEKASDLLSGLSEENGLTPFEAFIFLTAIQVHDAGHIIQANRGTHAIDTEKIIEELNKTICSLERNFIFDIAKAHSGKEDLIGNLPTDTKLSNMDVRPKLLAAILRFADELADGQERASNYLMEINKIPKESLIYHTFSSCLNTFSAVSQEQRVDMFFCVNKAQATTLFKKRKKDKKGKDTVKSIYLINEIYERTLKTFNEALYYNRFVPEEIRIKSIKVKITFIEPLKSVPFFDTIEYRLEEIGYPQLSSYDIFKICSSLTNKDGYKIDGKYINNQIKS